MSIQHWLTYRGALRALAPEGDRLLFVTAHPEGAPTALYRLDPLRAELESQPMPGGVALCVGPLVQGQGSARLWVVDPSGQLWSGPFGALSPVGARYSPVPAAIVALPSGAAALLTGSLLIVVAADGIERSRVDLDTIGTSIALDPSGSLLAVGCIDGSVVVLSSEGVGPEQFAQLSSAALHSGAVIAIRFEADEPRFLSLGTDRRILSTHARGELQPLDFSGRSGQAGTLLGFAGDGSHLYTIGEEGQIKAWPRGNAKAPSSLSNTVGKPFLIAEMQVEGKRHLVTGCRDDTLRFFPIDPQTGHVLERSRRFYGAIGRARRELMRSDLPRRRAALEALASYDDAESIALLVERASAETDHALQIFAVSSLGRSINPRSLAPLESLLASPVEALRKTAFDSLLSRRGARDLRTLKLALSSAHPDLSAEAVVRLGALAAPPDAVLARGLLREALSHSSFQVQKVALETLETLEGVGVADASLLGLGHGSALLRQAAAVRLFERCQLGDPRVRSALRAALDDPDADVRMLAYHLLLLSEPALAARLRQDDPDLQRALQAIEARAPGIIRPAASPKIDTTVLLWAAASPTWDSALRGASHLSLLGDERAFSMLLSLSRDAPPDIVVRVCRVFERSGERRAVSRLESMLRATHPQVRDAAFSALRRLVDSPLAVAAAGMLSSYPDVRQRALLLIIEPLKSRREPPAQAALVLLRAALNDTDQKLRSETFKAVLSIGIGGERSDSLRFVLASVHTDLRREVLTEVMTDVHLDWAWQILLDLLGDPDALLRQEAFTFARGKAKTEERERDLIAGALRSKHSDTRLLAVRMLAEQPASFAYEGALAEQLATVLDDDDAQVRISALAAAERARMRVVIEGALGSRHSDVRLRAARYLAARAVPAARAPLFEQIAIPRPENKDQVPIWLEHVKIALEGLAWLREPSATEPVAALLRDPDASIRAAAAHTLSQIASIEALRPHASHSDPSVRQIVASALAWRGEASGSALAAGSGTAVSRIAAALALGEIDRLIALLDADPGTAEIALRVLLLHDLADGSSDASPAEAGEGPREPKLLLAALSCASLRARLAVASILEVFHDTDALEERAASSLSPQPMLGSLPLARSKGAHPLPVPLLRSLARAVAASRGLDRVAVIGVIAETIDRNNLQKLIPHVSERWELAKLQSRGALADADTLPGVRPDLRALACGIYASLAARTSGPGVEGVPAAAIAKLSQMDQPGVEAVLLRALSSTNSSSALAAFGALTRAGADPGALAWEVLGPSTPLPVVRATIELLAERSGPDALLPILLDRATLAGNVALDLYREQRGTTPAARAALDSSVAATRARGIALLTEHIAASPGDADARALLLSALASRWPDVCEGAALALAELREPSAFEPLVALLRTDAQQKAITALVRLADPRTSGALLDRLSDDPDRSAITSSLFSAISALRQASAADRLMVLASERGDLAQAAIAAVRTIAGADQHTPWREDEELPLPEGQHPRRDDLLARLLRWHTERGAVQELQMLAIQASCARGKEVEAPLVRMLGHANARIRRIALSALRWRLIFRGAEPELLLGALSHRDPTTALLAAEALGTVGRPEGMTLLLSGMAAMKEHDLRRRAVLALGALGDLRTVEPLLRLVDDPRGELAGAAAEAIGRLGRSGSADAILSRLLQLSRGSSPLAASALTGLRWLGTPSAWARIREVASSQGFERRTDAIALLRYDHSDGRPQSQQLLTRCITEEQERNIVLAAASALRGLCGADSLEPDYIFLLSPVEAIEPDTISRLSERGDPAKLLQIAADVRCKDPDTWALARALSERELMPLAPVLSLLSGSDPRALAVAAYLLGKAREIPAPAGAGLLRAAREAIAALTERSARSPEQTPAERERREAQLLLCARWSLWALARHDLSADPHPLEAALLSEGPHAAKLRTVAQDALSVAQDLALLERIAKLGRAEARAIAADRVVRLAEPERTERLFEAILDDEPSVSRLLRTRPKGAPVTSSIASAALRSHTQGIVVGHLVASGGRAPLLEALQSETAEVRIGAIGALAMLGEQEALRSFATDLSRPEEERKAAWRALRRSKRSRGRQA